ncbi:MAG: hypothetical protein ABR574_09760 [Cryomorphaceae bacterium]|nr:hypothetical protein [Flavobacteriales bacterium]
MSDVSGRIEALAKKLSKVSQKLDELQDENKKLRSDVQSLETELHTGSRKLDALQKEYDRLKLAKALVSNTGDKAEMKFRVNELVREIDKCIALLNR